MINQGDTVVQVGMWHQDSAMRLAKSVGASGRILFIEISKASMETLKNSMHHGPCKNITYVNKGAWDSKGEFDLLIDENPTATRLDTGRLHPSHGKSTTLKAPVDTIENICREAGIEKIDYIEITVNGAELHALRGMGDLIQSTQRLWVAGLTRDPENGTPLNIALRDFLESKGLNAKISHNGRQANTEWGRLDGHVYG